MRVGVLKELVIKHGGTLRLLMIDQTANALAGVQVHASTFVIDIGGILEIVGAASLFVDILNVSGTLKATGGSSLVGGHDSEPCVQSSLCEKLGCSHGGIGGMKTYGGNQNGYSTIYGVTPRCDIVQQYGVDAPK